MKFSGELTVKAPREAVFDRFQDAPFFASCIEGVHDLKEITPTRYTALFETRIAYIRFKFEVIVDMTRAERPDTIEAKIEGKEVAGFVEEEQPTVDIMTALKESIKQAQRKPMVKATGKAKKQEEVEEAKPKKARKSKAS